MKSFFKIKNKNTAIYLACVAIASVMWLLIKLSKEYEIIVKIPILIENLPKDKILINKPDSLINVQIADNGFDLIRPSIFGISKPIIIHPNKLRHIKISDTQTKSYALTYSYYDMLDQMFNTVKRIKPDSIILVFEKEAEKMVKVSPQISVSYSPQYQVKNGIRISPDSIRIYGSKSDLESIDSILTEAITYSELANSVSEDIKLIIPKKTKADLHSTHLLINIEQFTEALISIPIQIQSSKQENIRVFPNQVQIKYAVSLNNYKLIQADQFEVIGKIDSLSVGKLELYLNKYPGNVRIIDYSPKMAEFIIIK